MDRLKTDGRQTQKKRFKVVFIGMLVLSAVNMFVMLSNDVQDSFQFSGRILREIHKNYFLDATTLSDMTLIVNTSNCHIPEFELWDPAILHLIRQAEPPEICTDFRWTYIKDYKTIVINESDIIKAGYKLNSIQCCYMIITRKEQDVNDYTIDAENLISYSDECYPIENETQPPKGEFFRVSCTHKKLSITQTLYTHYHAITKLKSDESDRPKKKAKVQYWENIKNEEVPPNIIFVGLDSTSRLNVRRNMFKTVDALKSIGAVEMLGYTKVGENTYPNMVTAFSGYDEDTLSNSCIEKGEKLDECPFIWKRLDEANYFTSHIEDTPRFTIFNYLKTGFVRQPTDFYPRAMFVAAHKDSPGLLNQLHLVKMNDFLHCIGYKLNDEIITEYVQSLLKMSRENNVPIFSFSWSTLMTHTDNNNCQIVDEIYANFISKINQTDNNIFFFLSDHGYRFTEFRETLIGWYEDKLPALWIYLPEKVKERFPQWEESLIVNSR